MKNLLVALVLSLGSSSIYCMEKTQKHCFSPKFFYRYHNEINFKYKTSGVGFEYSYFNPKGVNVKAVGLTNLKGVSGLLEAETTISIRLPLEKNHTFYPFFTSTYSTFQVEKVDKATVNIRKATAQGGIGFDLKIFPQFYLRAEGAVFHDLHNSFIVHEHADFWGKSFSNPVGAKGKIGILTEWKDKLFLDFECYYSRTFSKCYSECGSQISFKWGF